MGHPENSAEAEAAGSGDRVAGAPRWCVRVDTGGTFTDGWARDPEGREHRCKVLSSGLLRSRVAVVSSAREVVAEGDFGAGPGVLAGFFLPSGATVRSWNSRDRTLTFAEDHGLRVGDLVDLSSGEEAPVVAARLLTGTAPGTGFPPINARVGTTRATNALLERKGTRGLFVTTEGFTDLLQVRDQRRPQLFAIHQDLPAPLFRDGLGVPARIAPDGKVVAPLDLESLRAALVAEGNQEGGVAAVALLNAYANPEHERAIGDLLIEMGFHHVSLSSELSESIRLLPRAETAVANAYLSPIMAQFTGRLREGLPEASLALMTSAGHLAEVESFRPVDSLLSGPAGGVVGALAAGKAAGISRVLSFDMGGTSTDVARLDGAVPLRYEQQVGGVRVLAPAARIETVAAGGGSICAWSLGGLHVGPESAGADPGPACYGRGGPLTVTDVNLLLGLMDPGQAAVPLSLEAAQVALEDLKRAMRSDGADVPGDRELLEGLREIAVERMADAIRTVSLREGSDPREYALVAFGGAGPQHACAVADKLGVTTILMPQEAGILSAWGMHHALREEIVARQFLARAEGLQASWRDELEGIIDEACARLPAGGVLARVLVEVRLHGQDGTLDLAWDRRPDLDEVCASFAGRYRDLYGYAIPQGREVEIVTVRAVATEPGTVDLREAFGAVRPSGEATEIQQDGMRTCIIEPGWEVARGTRGSLLLRKAGAAETLDAAAGVIADELYRGRFERVVEDMGQLLQRTALSTNVKERHDFSCALLDADGRLVVNAPHIPVHLGALGLCVREVSRVHEWREGDMVVVNHPAYGGSHLPDVTVISPVFAGGKPACFVANRAHHAEIGGLSPGSMPATARCLEEEGVVIPPMLLFDRGEERFGHVRRHFESARYPSRCLEDNLADLAAQAAANHFGVGALKQLIQSGGAGEVRSHLAQLYRRAASVMGALLAGQSSHQWSGEDAMDDGTPLRVVLRHREGRLAVDFSGSGGPHQGNLNATPAVVRSAVLYVLRLWTQADLPLNEGLLDAVDVVTPHGFLNPQFPDDPAKCPAVVGGNVETSQHLVDLLLSALGLMANSQGTMNNVLFGNEQFGYYETIGGGGGGSSLGPGTSGTHVHMSNTAITDPEILERRFPLRLREFSLRRGSGGTGIHRGGDGLVRVFEFLDKLTVSLLTQRRTIPPRGQDGGGAGQCGRQSLVTAGGVATGLPPVATLEVGPGDTLRVETPGGGGWGSPE